ncbi:hypothetical protein PXK00_04435 [Phaeobacter sp. QD34_3]|uniref:hypothetical protein n=1 Tax=unclassified Phaeobacter TaxID=2621772 RepID=UPI00237F1BB3|nr:MULTISPECIES: hypothetical protein [unclassified Phaeobacter]MDE4132344.1 hypothetical protein [Phaeobacter sp. QD34_3]MDE4135982.1 hypothetical protein [Phaeobacter sp. QD34_24]
MTGRGWAQRNSVTIRAACAALIAVGFLQLIDARILGSSIGVFSILALMVWAVPLVPLIAILAERLRKTPVSPVLAKSASIAFLLSGVLLTLIVSAFASPKSGLMVMFHGGALSLGAAASLLFLGGKGLGPFAARAALSGMAVATVVALWSILAAVMVVGHANRLAAGAPFCIAHHGPSAQVRSIWDLRGFSFYTTDSGYKLNSGWYFHGVMIVDKEGGRQYFNWSPRRMRFERIEHPGRFIAPLRDLCEPSLEFWSEV